MVSTERGGRAKLARRAAGAACVLALGFALGACGSSAKASAPATTVTTGTPVTSAAATVPTTTIASTTTTAPHPSTPPTLVAGAYGFKVPAGWKLSPLTNAGGPASFATYTDPNGPGKIEYVTSGGESGVIYNADHSPNVRGAMTGVGCTLATSDVVSAARGEFACVTTGDNEITGAVIVNPYTDGPRGWKYIKITMPHQQYAVAKSIVQSFS